MNSEEDKKYVFVYVLSHPQTNQQPLANKNVLSVIVNYKYWASLYCSLLIMLNGLPLTIMKPLTHCLSMCMCMCVWDKVSVPAYLRKYALVFLWPWRLQWLALNLRVCSLSALLSLMSQTKIKRAKRGGGEDMRNMNQVTSKTIANVTLVWCSGLITEHSAHAQTHKHC